MRQKERGCDSMLETTINQVKEAEEAADKRRKSAKEQADAIVERAKADAALLSEQRVGQAEEQAAAAMEKAKKEGEQLLDQAIQKVNMEIETLKSKVSHKEGEVIKVLVSELF